MQRFLISAIVFLSIAVTGQGAHSQSFTWSPPIDLSNAGPSVDVPSIVVSKDGSRAMAAWREAKSIQTSTATITNGIASWGPVVVLASGGVYSAPAIQLSSDGSKATAFWQLQ